MVFCHILDQENIIIKMPSKEKPTLKDEARFQRQYEVVSDFNYDGIIKKQ